MDHKLLTSILGTSPSREAETGPKRGEVQPDAFEAALNKATSSAGSKQSQEVISEKAPGKGEKSRPREEAEAARRQGGEPLPKGVRHPLGSKAWLYQLAYRNPDSLSLSERQALKTGEFSQEAVGLRELQRMLEGKGLQLKDLPFQELSELTRASSKEEVSARLDRLVEDRQGAQGGETPLVSLAGAHGAGPASPRPSADTSAEGALAIQATQRASEARQTAATRRRQEVIDQIIQKMEIRSLSERDELHLKLNPEYLGELKIQLSQGSDGEIQARFLTTSGETRDLLVDARADLREHVERRGLKLRHIDVDLVEALS